MCEFVNYYQGQCQGLVGLGFWGGFEVIFYIDILLGYYYYGGDGGYGLGGLWGNEFKYSDKNVGMNAFFNLWEFCLS